MNPRLRWAYAAPLVAALVVFAGLAVGAVLVKHSVAQDEGPGVVADVGGLEYRALDVRLLHPKNAGDARMLQGLAPKRPDQVWFGAFLTARNAGHFPRPMATQFTLRDIRGRSYRPVALRAGNPVAYRPRTVSPGFHSPGQNTPAQRDLAAEGGLVLFLVPRSAYDAGPLELVIQAPGNPRTSGELFLSS
jgi:hypothetical protein